MEDIVMRTAEFKDKNFHFQKFLGRKTRVWVMGQGSPNQSAYIRVDLVPAAWDQLLI